MAEIIDDFEDEDLTEYYGDVDIATISSEDSASGGSHLFIDPVDSTPTIYSDPEDGLNTYPEQGHVFRLWIRTEILDGQFSFLFGCDAYTNDEGALEDNSWSVGADSTSTVTLNDGYSGTEVTGDYVLPENEWIEVEVDWGSTATGETTATFYYDGTQQDQLTITSNSADALGIGFSSGSAGDKEAAAFHWDGVRITDTDDSPDPIIENATALKTTLSSKILPPHVSTQTVEIETASASVTTGKTVVTSPSATAVGSPITSQIDLQGYPHSPSETSSVSPVSITTTSTITTTTPETMSSKADTPATVSVNGDGLLPIGHSTVSAGIHTIGASTLSLDSRASSKVPIEGVAAPLTAEFSSVHSVASVGSTSGMAAIKGDSIASTSTAIAEGASSIVSADSTLSIGDVYTTSPIGNEEAAPAVTRVGTRITNPSVFTTKESEIEPYNYAYSSSTGELIFFDNEGNVSWRKSLPEEPFDIVVDSDRNAYVFYNNQPDRIISYSPDGNVRWTVSEEDVAGFGDSDIEFLDIDISDWGYLYILTDRVTDWEDDWCVFVKDTGTNGWPDIPEYSITDDEAGDSPKLVRYDDETSDEYPESQRYLVVSGGEGDQGAHVNHNTVYMDESLGSNFDPVGVIPRYDVSSPEPFVFGEDILYFVPEGTADPHGISLFSNDVIDGVADDDDALYFIETNGSNSTRLFKYIAENPSESIHPDNDYAEIVWERSINSSSGSIEIDQTGTIYVGCESDGIRAYNADDGSEAWTLDDESYTTVSHPQLPGSQDAWEAKNTVVRTVADNSLKVTSASVDPHTPLRIIVDESEGLNAIVRIPNLQSTSSSTTETRGISATADIDQTVGHSSTETAPVLTELAITQFTDIIATTNSTPVSTPTSVTIGEPELVGLGVSDTDRVGVGVDPVDTTGASLTTNRTVVYNGRVEILDSNEMATSLNEDVDIGVGASILNPSETTHTLVESALLDTTAHPIAVESHSTIRDSSTISLTAQELTPSGFSVATPNVHLVESELSLSEINTLQGIIDDVHADVVDISILEITSGKFERDEARLLISSKISIPESETSGATSSKIVFATSIPTDISSISNAKSGDLTYTTTTLQERSNIFTSITLTPTLIDLTVSLHAPFQYSQVVRKLSVGSNGMSVSGENDLRISGGNDADIYSSERSDE